MVAGVVANRLVLLNSTAETELDTEPSNTTTTIWIIGRVNGWTIPDFTLTERA